MRLIDLNDYLCSDNIWARRLLGIEPFQQHRTMDLIEREYDSDLYGKRLSSFMDDLDALRVRVLRAPEKEIVVSIKDQIAVMFVPIFLTIKCQYMVSTLNRYTDNTEVCELGAGYGQNLLRLQAEQERSLYGGEYSDNAVALAKLLGLEVHHFNFYEPVTYEFIRRGTTVFTSHSVEQIPDAQVIIGNLKRIRNRLSYVVHFEPLYRQDRHNLIGLLRNKYTNINDYNKNLLECLRRDPEIDIVYMETDVFGRNPLNPTSILVWKFM